MKSVSAALVLLFCSFATANNPPGTSRAVSYVDTFDAIGPVAQAPGAFPVGGTAGGALYYRSWNYDTSDPLIVKPASSPNVITTGEVSQTKSGEPAFLPINSTVKCFDLKRICYACILNSENGAASVAEACTIQLTGVLGCVGLNATVLQELVYNNNGAAQSMTCTSVAPTFSCVTEVDIQVIYAVAGNSPDVTAPLLDNVTYIAYY